MNLTETNHAKKPCLICGTKFKPRHKKHNFCKRKCFLVYNRKKNIGYPMYKCDFCGCSSQLDFSPRHFPEKWRNFKCLNCGRNQTEAITAALIPRTAFTTNQVVHVTITGGSLAGSVVPGA